MMKLSTRLIRKGALIDESRTILRLWDVKQGVATNLDRILADNPIGAQTHGWLREVRSTLMSRLTAMPAAEIPDLTELARSSMDRDSWCSCFLWHVGRVDFLYYHFATGWLYDSFHDGTYKVRVDDAVPIVQKVMATHSSGGRELSDYRRFLATAENILNHLGRQYDLHDDTVQARLRTLPPSQADSLGAAWNAILQDLADADELRQIAHLRVIDGQEPDPDRIWSLSDPDARLIKKGGRDTVFGYRPTLVRSKSGLLTALCLDRGNTADSTLVLQVIDAHKAATGVRPSAASFDDGYANKQDARLATKQGTLVSVSGAKGKRQTDPTDWDSEIYSRLRQLRPQVESDINALKQRHGWARLSRRGLDAVRASLLEGMIAYNLLKLRRLRQASQAAAQAA